MRRDIGVWADRCKLRLTGFSIHLHPLDPRRGAQRAGDLRRDLVAAGEPDLDLALAGVEDQDQGDLPFPALPQALLHAADRLFAADEDAHRLMLAGDGLVQWLGGLDAGSNIVALEPGLQNEHEGTARLQKIAV